MSTEWNEDNIRGHLFTEVEVSTDGTSWFRRKLGGFCPLKYSPFFTASGVGYRHMRLITKPTKRLMKPIELGGRWLDFGDDGVSLVIGYDDDYVYTRDHTFAIRNLNHNDDDCQGWRDTPTSELHTSFEVDE